MIKKGGINISSSGNFISQTTDSSFPEMLRPEKFPENHPVNEEFNTEQDDVLDKHQVEILLSFEDKVMKLNHIEKILNSIIDIKNETIMKDIDIKNEEVKKRMLEPHISIKDFTEQLLSIRLKSENKDVFQREIVRIKSELNSEIQKAGLMFADTINSTLNRKMLVSGQIDKIGHKEYKNESKIHYDCIVQIEKKLDFDTLSGEDFTFMSSKGIAAAHVIKEIEKHNQVIEVLVDADKIKTRKTKSMVITSLSSFIILITLLIVVTSYFNINISDRKLPFLGVPLQVIIWGFIGSFASMIYRFNKKPIYDFGDSVKWLITRPVQGVILSAAFYLVLISSQFVFSGADSVNGLVNSHELILMFSFLIGFSDKFADKAFSTLIDKYISKNSAEEEKSKTESSTENRQEEDSTIK